MTAEPCPSYLELDRYMLSELSQSRQQVLEQHLRSCASCQAHLSEAQRATQQLQHIHPTFAALEHSIQRRRAPNWTRRARSWTLMSMGVAAAASVGMWWSGAWVLTQEVGWRSKGGLGFSYHVKRADHIFAGGVDEVLTSGDAIQFTVQTSRPGYLAIVSVDGRGAASVYYPLGTVSAKLPVGRHTLPLSTVLDEALGREHVWAIYCEASFETAQLRERLQTLGPSALDQHGCQTAALSFEKRAPGGPR